LRSFQPRTLLVKGTGSTAWLHQVIDELAANIPNARIIELPGGHAPIVVAMLQFLEELEKFQNDTIALRQ
jgi:hypothetical protein